MRTSRYVAQFDSASGMLHANARFLHGRDWPMRAPFAPLNLVMRVANYLPVAARDKLYIFGGWKESVSPAQLAKLRTEDLSRWIIEQYPRRRYPAIAIGSSNGAATHLWSALEAPWLPQTLLIPVHRKRIHPDDMRKSIEDSREAAEMLLENNPDLQLHLMHDPNQDRLMVRCMDYFRVKRLRLGETWTRFLEESLEPGGTIFLVECNLQWPTTELGPRSFFQPGAYGGARAEEYVVGSPRVEAFLRRHNSPWTRWDPPAPDALRPEAEWGFEPALREDVERLARRCGYRVRRIVFDDPIDLSPLVADLYRWWYARRGIEAARLLVESFLLLDPWWTLRTGSVPFWTVFPVESSADALEAYVNEAGPFEEIYPMLFAHGVESVGLAPIDRWRSLLSRATRRGSFLGVDEAAFPKDFATYVRYHKQLRNIPGPHHPMPPPLSIEALDEFLDDRGDAYAVHWRDDGNIGRGVSPASSR
ncbi:MAG: hypothetical protein KY475_06355 [Planctomycetes bacterium]|nr:hypothetical protein [Planctomycetota bacterium]